MNNHYVKFLGLTCLLIASVSASTGSAEETDFYQMSKYWPQKVTVHKDIVGETHGNTVPGGRAWEFMRYQDGKCLVDMGHNGIFWLAPEETDLRERMLRLENERQFPFQGLFTFRYTKSFYDPETLKGYQLRGELDEVEYFVLFYFDYDKSSPKTHALGIFISEFQEILKAEYQLGVLLLPTQDPISTNGFEDYIDSGFNAPTVVPYLQDGVIHSLQHKASKNGDVVVVDKFGKVLGQFFLQDLGEQADSDALLSVLRKILP